MFNAQDFLSTVTTLPGVYCMKDSAGKVIYVGKAKNLKSRLTSYFRPQGDIRIHQLVSKIASIDTTITASEKEALLLEISLIKTFKPRYNVLFKDDKSYPYLFLSKHAFPRLVYLRGKQKIPGHYFGPYPSTIAVRETLNLLQKLFKLRQCDDTFFSHRSRPCLQYQIKRCTAPCVGYISEKDYAQAVENVSLFLHGKESFIIEDLVKQMENASKHQDFELASELRDQIIHLRIIHEQQVVFKQEGNADVIAVSEFKGHFCIQLLYIRQGKILDNQSFFPKQTGESSSSEILRGFLIQYYLDHEDKIDFPSEIILNVMVEDQELIASALSQIDQKKIEIIQPQRGEKMKWLEMALNNAQEALSRKVAHSNVMQKRWQELKKVLGISHQVNRMECFDISHMQGEATIASCVVFDQSGPVKSEYRRYNIEGIGNDDYAAMEQVLTRRYSKRKAQDLPMPEIIIVDGGKGQLHRAAKVMLECQILDTWLIGIAKGEGRKPGLETLYVQRSQSDEEYIVKLAPNSQALHLLQQIRDEAHRFAITGSRKKTAKTRRHSPLESIPGVGEKRRQKLVNFFGGQQGLLAASKEAIARVPGIGKNLAQIIYAALHDK